MSPTLGLAAASTADMSFSACTVHSALARAPHLIAPRAAREVRADLAAARARGFDTELGRVLEGFEDRPQVLVVHLGRGGVGVHRGGGARGRRCGREVL